MAESKNALVNSAKYSSEVYKEDWQWQEGEYTVTRTSVWTGPGCHDGCGVLTYVKDGKLEKVEGDPNCAYNQGRLCLRCLNMKEQIYNPDRLKWPLKRAGEKGENKWERISWDEAYDTIYKRVRDIQDNYGAETIVTLTGTGRNAMWQGAMCLRGCFGSPNMAFGFLSADSCYQPRMTTNLIKEGDCFVADLSQFHPARYDNPEWVLPEVILVWGNQPLVSNGDGFLGHWIIDCMRLGSKIITVDPALTWIAAKSELWLRVRPGADTPVIMGMLNVIINEELYDKEWVEQWGYGFEELVERVQQYPPEKCAEISWVPKEQIVEAARMFAKAKPATLQWGLAIDMQPSAMELSAALNDLVAMTGNLDKPGGNIMERYAYNSSKKYGCGLEFISEEMLQKRIGTYSSPIHESGYTPFIPPDELLLTMESDKPYKVQMIWVHGTNPIANMAGEAPRVYAAWKKVPFTVVLDYYITPTAAAFADIVLPMAMSVERDSYRSWWQPLRAITKSVDDYYECKTDETVVLELGKMFRPEFFGQFETVRDFLTWMIWDEGNGVDYSFEELTHKVNDWWDWNYTYEKYEKGLLRQDGAPGFVTATGLYEFTPPLYDIWGFDTLPKHNEPLEGPYGSPEKFKEYPFVLTTGNRLWGCFHSEHRQLSRMREIHPEPYMDIHPDAAAALGVNEEDWVWIENMRGRCKQKVRFNVGLDPRVIRGEHGWWFPEKEGSEPTLFGVFDSNINNLTTMGVYGPMHYGAPYKCTIAKVYKCTEENSEVLPSVQVSELGGFDYVKGSATYGE